MKEINLNNCKFYDFYFNDKENSYESCGISFCPTVFTTIAVENPQKYLYQKLKSLLYSYNVSNKKGADRVKDFLKYAKSKGIIDNYKIISCTPIKLKNLRMPNKYWG